MYVRSPNPAKKLLREGGLPDITLPSSQNLPQEEWNHFYLHPWREVHPTTLLDVLDSFRYRSYEAKPIHPLAYVDKIVQPVLDILNGLLRKDDSPTLSAHRSNEPGFPPGITISLDPASMEASNPSASEGKCYCIVLLLAAGTLHPDEWTYEKNDDIGDLQRTSSWPSWLIHASHALRRSSANRTTHVLLADSLNTVLLCFRPRNIEGRIVIEYSTGEKDETFRFSLARLLFDRSVEDKHNRAPIFPTISGSYLRRGTFLDPELPIPTDEEIFSSCHSFSDFDVYMMQNSNEDYPLFARWKARIDKMGRDEILRTGLRLKGTSSGFLAAHLPYRSPLAPPDLPSATRQKIAELSRPRCGALDVAVSGPFEIEITSFIRGGPNHWSQAAFGRIVRPLPELDAPAEPLPEIFLKLYDERFFGTPPWREAGNDDSLLGAPGPLAYFHPAAELVGREEAAYYSLRHAQGSYFPHCYGFHEFTYPSGWKTYGMITEIIPGQGLKAAVRDASTSQLRELITEMRHAVRILRYADLHQTDWNAGQIMVMRERDRIVPVLLDFAFALQSQAGYDKRECNDVAFCENILIGARVPETLVEELWEPADDIEI